MATAEYGQRTDVIPGVIQLDRIYPTFPTDEEVTERPELTRRVGLIARKAGMTQLWDDYGMLHPVTILGVSACQVSQVIAKDGRHALQVAAFNKAPRKITKPMRGHFDSCGIPCKQYLREFPVSADALLPVGTELTARHFVPGQLVDVCGTGRGKGFAGVMKRHGFGGGNASHGASKAHRTPGSTGGCQDPGKVWKGKKMPGRMGGKRVTVENLRVFRVDCEANLILVEGHVPGPRGGVVFVRDALKRLAERRFGPVPTCDPVEDESALGVLAWDLDGKNPWHTQGDDNVVKF